MITQTQRYQPNHRNTFLNQLTECTVNAGKMFSKPTVMRKARMPLDDDDEDSNDGDRQTGSSIKHDSLDVLLRCDGPIIDKVLSPDQCGFEKSYIKNEAALYCTPRADSRATVSLALINRQCSILQKYANKLPIMTINVSRLLYTIEAFFFDVSDNVEKRNKCLSNALEFYIATDLKGNEPGDCTDNPGKPSAANQQFSEFLHRLRSNGYIRYIFALATKLNLNVDLVNCSNPRIVTRYMRIEYRSGAADKSQPMGFVHRTSNTFGTGIGGIYNSPANTAASVAGTNTRGNRNFPSAKKHAVSVGIGYLTVVHQDENRWYVKTTKTPIVNATPPPLTNCAIEDS